MSRLSEVDCIATASVLMFTSLLFLPSGQAGTIDATITLDHAITYQTMTGWEATAWAGQNASPAFYNYTGPLFDEAVKDLGLNRLRLEIRSGVENPIDYWWQYRVGIINYSTWRSLRYSTVNDDGDPNSINWSGFHFSEMDATVRDVVLPFKQRVEARGERFILNVNYVAFTGQIGPGLQYIHDDPDEYADFVLAAYLHLQGNFSLVPDLWEVILEPDNVVQWRSGAVIGQAIASAARRLGSQGFVPSFVASSTTNMGNAIPYFDAMIAIPGVLGNLTELSYHRYGGVSDQNLAAIASRATAYGIDTGMLEHIGSGYQDLHKDLALGNNSVWQQYTIAGLTLADSGGQYYMIDDSNPANPIILMGSRTKFLRQYFKFVREGAIRINATSDNATFDPVAFVNADGRNVVVVKCAAGGSFSMRGLPAGTYGIKYTTPALYDMNLPDARVSEGESVEASIPTAGVLTVYGISLPNRPPTANAGSDQTVPKGTMVVLPGTGSDPDGDQLAFSWRQAGGPSVILGGSDTDTARFAPTVTGQHTFRLAISDGWGHSSTDTVIVTAANRAPVIIDSTPLDSAPGIAVGARLTIAVAAMDPDGDALTYLWKVDGSSVAADLPFYLFDAQVQGTFTVNLTVSDGEAQTWRQWTVTATSPEVSQASFPSWLVALVALLLVALAAVLLLYLREKRRKRVKLV